MEGQKDFSGKLFDVIIIGAGVSGIDVAYRLQTQVPEYTYAILEARDSLGGTWDLFRYPGVRSDSDLYTYGFPWRPWEQQSAIASGPSIIQYMKESAAEYHIDSHIQFHKKLTAANWSSDQQLWQLTVDGDGHKEIYHSRFLVMGTGYYDYQSPRSAIIPGLENFKGTIVHPQFWPEDLDLTDKKVVIIGSGATAVTILPSIAEKASVVTMLQRSPSYVASRPTSDFLESFFSNWLPKWLAIPFKRWKNILQSILLFQWCMNYPKFARAAIKKETMKQLPPTIQHDPHFEPAYDPWRQRFCVCPDGDFFAALRAGKCNIVTDTIKTMTADHIILTSGQELDADVIVTATGLRILIGGGAQVSVDNVIVRPCEKFIWKAIMLQDLPNAFFIIGYTNASWTLGADASALLLCRIMRDMMSHGMTNVVPRLGKDSEEEMKELQFMNLSSTYLREPVAMEQMPKAGDRGPWQPRSTYLRDYWVSRFGGIREGLVYEKSTISCSRSEYIIVVIPVIEACSTPPKPFQAYLGPSVKISFNLPDIIVLPASPERHGIAIAEIAVFAVILPVQVGMRCCQLRRRTGASIARKNALRCFLRVWLNLVVIFAQIRIIGFALHLGVTNPSRGVVISEVVLQSVGLSPLLLELSFILLRCGSGDATSSDERIALYPKVLERMLKYTRVPILVALVLIVIAGSILNPSFLKAGAVLVLATFFYLACLTILITSRYRRKFARPTQIGILAAIASLPLYAVRAIYLMLVEFAGAKFDPIVGDWRYMTGLGFAMEVGIVILLVIAGIAIEPLRVGKRFDEMLPVAEP